MIIFGIDPGTQRTGFGIIKLQGNRLIPVDYGCIRTPANVPLSQKYRIIFESLCTLITTHLPEAVAVETQYVQHNIQSAIKLGMARGAAVLAASTNDIPIYEYSPTRAKKSVVGRGRAGKQQVQKMIQHLLSLATLPEPEDAADALSLAICHANSIATKQKLMLL